jgi:hypothetical protein
LSFKVFHESVSPGPLSVPVGQFRFFYEISRRFRESVLISSVNDTGNKREKILRYKLFHILFKAYLSALYTCRMNFCLFYIFRPRQPGTAITVLFIGGVIDTGEQLFGGVVDTGNKF